MRYIAYFQAYTNTYAPLETLRRRYEEALSVEGVVGLIIGTRPDCVPDATLDYIAELNRQTFVMLEYGIESASDTTLQRINRCHSYAEAEDAVCRTAARNVPVGAHIILGLPGETREEMLQHADRLSSLPLTSVKLHQLQLVRGTLLERGGEYGADNLTLFTLDEYIETVKDFIARLRPDIYIDRFVSQSPPELVIAPRWGVKNHEFRNLLRKRGVTWNRRN
jgi:radical SAM protein (TIGR01212 family)